MKRVFYAIGLLLMVQGVAGAACPDEQVLKVVGAPLADDGIITTNGQDVNAILVDCSGTACTGGFYNADTLGAAVLADLKAHVGGAANTTTFLDLTDAPLYFSDGVTFVDDANVDAALIYSCQPR